MVTMLIDLFRGAHHELLNTVRQRLRGVWTVSLQAAHDQSFLIIIALFFLILYTISQLVSFKIISA